MSERMNEQNFENPIIAHLREVQQERMSLALNWIRLEWKDVDLVFPMAYGLLSAINQLATQEADNEQ